MKSGYLPEMKDELTKEMEMEMEMEKEMKEMKEMEKEMEKEKEMDRSDDYLDREPFFLEDRDLEKGPEINEDFHDTETDDERITAEIKQIEEDIMKMRRSPRFSQPPSSQLPPSQHPPSQHPKEILGLKIPKIPVVKPTPKKETLAKVPVKRPIKAPIKAPIKKKSQKEEPKVKKPPLIKQIAKEVKKEMRKGFKEEVEKEAMKIIRKSGPSKKEKREKREEKKKEKREIEEIEDDFPIDQLPGEIIPINKNRILVKCSVEDLFENISILNTAPQYNRTKDKNWIASLKKDFDPKIMPPLSLGLYRKGDDFELGAIDSQHRLVVLEELYSKGKISDEIIVLDIHIIRDISELDRLLFIANKRKHFDVETYKKAAPEPMKLETKIELLRGILKQKYGSDMVKTLRPYLKVSLLKNAFRMEHIASLSVTKLAENLIYLNSLMKKEFDQSEISSQWLKWMANHHKLAISTLQKAVNMGFFLGIIDYKNEYSWMNILDLPKNEIKKSYQEYCPWFED